MLLQKENIKRPVRRTPIRESMDDRLYITKKKASLREDDDVVIDFDDDIDGIEFEGNGYQPKKDKYEIPSHDSNIRHPSDNIQSILLEINDRLANIENMLRSNNEQKVTVTTQQTTTTPVNESLMNGDIMNRLRPPQNVVPEGSMLGEIQSVLAQQASLTGNDSQTTGAADVSGICTLPTSAYDDEVPDIE